MSNRALEEAGRLRSAAGSVASRISLGDERMALVTRLAAETGDPHWSNLYERTGLEIDRAIEDAKHLAAPGVEKQFVSATALPVARLYEMERAAILLGSQGRRDDANKILANPSYDAFRRQLIDGTNRFVAQLSKDADAHVESVRYRHRLLIALICVLGAFGFAVLWRVLTNYTARAEIAQRRMQGEIAQLQIETASESAKTEAIAKLTGGIAHEFNNLLAVVVGNLDLVTPALPEDSELRELLEAATEASLRSADLTHQLLAFARNQPLFEQQADLNALLESIGDELQRDLPPEFSIVIETGVDQLYVSIDPGQFKQALKKVIQNAVEAMPAGGQVLIGTEVAYGPPLGGLDPRQYVSVSVSDTGVGIPKEERARVLEPFFSTKQNSAHAGLGLSMVQGFMKQSGGNIEVVSEIGRGSTIRMCFPTVRRDEVQLRQDSGPIGEDGATKLILVVDDDQAVRATVAAQLVSLGYRTLEAVDGPDALRKVRDEPDIELVLTDIVMPGMSGLELGRALSVARPDLRVVYTSGFPRETVAADNVPPERFLAKPYRKKDLAQKVGQLLPAI